MKTSEKIIEYIKSRGQATGSELAEYLELSDRAVRKQLASLLKKDNLGKIGKPPKVFYTIKKYEEKVDEEGMVSDNVRGEIKEAYLLITPAGERKTGFEGFVYWCQKNNLPLEKTANEYVQTLSKYRKYKRSGFIDGKLKMESTFKKVYLNKLYYLDFYSIERFGKTRLGQLLLYAKQSQDRKLMKELILEIKPKIDKLIAKYSIDGLGFVPPTVKREVQFMRVLEQGLKENVRSLKITKVKTPIIIPQKTLNKLKDRIENAKNTFVVEENAVFRNVLLLDDAVGSGATLNEIAKKIRDKNICQGKIIALSITGSFKGFDVISEV